MSSRFKQFRVAIILSCSALLTPAAHSAPTGGQVSAGSGNIAQTGTVTTINQSSQNMAINWQDFGIGANETVNFNQPNASSIALNRVMGQDPSQIFGSLNANGQVFVLNPNGVLFGKGSQVNVGGLVASTLSLSDADFMSGNYQFSGTGAAGSVINQGNLNATDGGYIALLAPEVRNEGVISATLGTALLAAGDKVTVKFDNGSLLSYSIDQGAIDALADNRQLLKADGGQVIMSAKAANALSSAVVNNTGILEAHTVRNINGVITLMGDMQSGQVNVGGTLDASAPDSGNGGFIETSAAQVQIANDAKVSTLSSNGTNGTWLIDPVDFTIAATGGNITGAALSSNLGAGNVTILSSSGNTGTAGDVNVDDVVDWSANKLTINARNNININANLNASGAASLALEYGQAALAAGNLSDYYLNNGSKVNLPGGNNFSTKLGSNGVVKNFTVITALGAEGSTTGTDLQGINGNLAGNYVLGANIDATSTSGWNAGSGFVPLGIYPSTNFSGTLDGLGHTINNLYINPAGASYVGLIGYATSTSAIRNVGLTNVSLLAVGGYGGGLAGYSAGSISNSYVTGTLAGDTTLSGDWHWGGYILGGLVGWLNQGIVTNCHANVTVTTVVDQYAAETGGLVGVNYQGSITNSYATGDVTGENVPIGLGIGGFGSRDIGGLVGDNYGEITNSYATGNVTGWALVGGLVGGSYGAVGNSYALGNVEGYDSIGGLIGVIQSSGATVAGSYSAGHVVGTNNGGATSPNVGGLIAYSIGTVASSYWDTTTSGQATSAGGIGLTTAQMMQQASLTGFDFTNTWWISETNTRPFLRMEHTTDIINPHQLQLMSMDLTANYTLGANIDLSVLTSANDMWDITKGFVPVGDNFSGYTGTFDGLGHTVSNLTISRPAESYVGLFGYATSGAAIRNVGLSNVSVLATAYAGGLAGYSAGSISHSYATGTVTGDSTLQNGYHYAGYNMGGLVGYLDLATVTDCYASVAVTTFVDQYTAAAGGLVGWNNGGTISNSYATGDVHGENGGSYSYGNVGSNEIGGLVGHNGTNQTNYGTITNSYATGNVIGWAQTGGLVGFAEDATVVSNSHSTGTVTGFEYVGGLIGYVGPNWTGATVSNSYATGNVDGYYWVGGLIGVLNPGSILSNSYASGNVTGGGTALTGGFGGLVGWNYGGTISKSYAVGNVSAPTVDVGGLVGSNETFSARNNIGSIADSYATGNVNGSNSVGGLVGVNNGGTISNSHYATGTVTGNNDVGGLIGHSYASGTISDSYSTGTVSAAGYEVGGLVGNFSGGSISNSYATGSLATTGDATTGTKIGGLVGWNNGGTISGSFASSDVTASSNSVGGLVGRNSNIVAGTTGQISNCYATGAVTGSSTVVGGLVGNNAGGILTNTYSTGSVSGTGANVGGLVGNNGGGTVTSSYWDTTTSGQATSAAGVGLTTAQMKQQASYTGWDFANTWIIYNGDTYPLLRFYMTPLTVTADNATKTYDRIGYADPISVTYSSTPDGRLLGTPTNVGSASGAVDAGTYNITPSGLYSTQFGYAMDFVSGSLVVNQAPLTVSGASAGDKTYDGTTLAFLTGGVLNGVISGDTVTLNETGTFASKNVGTAIVVTAADSLAGSSAPNYYLSAQPSGLTANITKATLSVTANNATKTYGVSKTYLGTEFTSLGLVNNETIGTVTLSSTGDNGTANVSGSPYAITPSAATGGTFSASNYAITYVNGAMTVDKAPLTVTANDVTKTYNGLPYTGGNGASHSGLVNGETSAVLGGTLVYSGTSQGAINVSGYVIIPSGLTSGNYAISFANGALTVNKAPLTVTANNVIRDYDGQTYSGASLVQYSGLVNGESSAVLGGTLTFGGSSQGAVNAGNYVIAPSGLASGNYAFTYVNGTLSVNKVPLSVTANSASKTYGVSQTYSGTEFTSLGLVNNETIATVTLSSLGDAGTANVSGSPYSIVPSAATGGSFSANNYNITYVNGTLTVSKAPLTVTANNASKTYNGLSYSGGNGATYSGLVNGENSSVLGGTLAYSGTSQGAVNAASYVITPSGLTSGNYAITFQNGALTVNKAPLTVTAVNDSKVYDGLAYSGGNGATYSGLVNSETSAVLGGTLAYSGTSQGAVNAASYVITPSGLTSGNYNITYANGALTVSQAPLSITANGYTKTYDGLTYSGGNGVTYTGLVNSETSAVLGGTLAYSGTSQGAVNAASYVITPSGLTSGNYAITFVNGTLAVSRLAISVTGTVVGNKVYDGTTNATLSGGTLSGVLSGDTVTLTQSGTFGSKNVGTAIAVTATDALGGNSAANYQLTQPTGLTADITQATLSASIVGTPTKVYDATTTATLSSSNYSLTGFVTGEGATVGQTAGTYNSANVLTANTVTTTLAPADFTANTGTSLSNYILPTSASGAGIITPAGYSAGASASTRLANRLEFRGTPFGNTTGSYLITPNGQYSTLYNISFGNDRLTVLSSPTRVDLEGGVFESWNGLWNAKKPRLQVGL